MVGGRNTRLGVGTARRSRRTQSTRTRWLVFGCVLMLGALISLFSLRGARILDLRQHIRTSLADYDTAMVEHEDLQAQLARKDNLTAIEDAARRLLGWVKPGEERVVFVDRTAASGEGE
jgi:hypothetical protein